MNFSHRKDGQAFEGARVAFAFTLGAGRVPATCKLALFLVLAIFPLIARAADITLQGTFTADDNVQLFSVSLAGAAPVDIRSYGYAGGTTSTGTVVPRGGFDTILTLFSASGVFIDDNDEGAGVAVDPTTGLPADARLTDNLAASSYIVALTQYDNFSIGNLADGFAETGNPHFTADPTFAAGGPCPDNMFRDISGTAGRCRTGNWALDFANVSSVTPAAAVPEPSALLFVGFGLALLLLGRCRQRRKAAVLACGFVAALASLPVHAQTGPNYSNVDDFLQGQRTLLSITDLQTVTTSTYNQINFNQLFTSNSSVTKTSPFPAQIPGDIYNPSGFRSFSGLMFNQPQPVTVTEVNASQTASTLHFATTNIHNAGPWFSDVKDPYANFFTAGAMADFNQDGYADFAFSMDDGTIGIATAANVNNPWAGTDGPFNLGPLATLDVLTDMTAGDFKGDGHHEIAGLAFTVVDGVKLVIYTVDPGSLAITPASSFVFSTPLGYKIQYASITRGQFTTTAHDQLAVAFSSAVGPTIVQIVDFTPNTLTPVGGPQLTASTVSIPVGYLQVTSGKFGFTNGDLYDQIVFHMSSTSDGGRFFQVISANPTDLSLTAHSGITYDQYPCAATNGVQVGDFDNQQTSQHNPDSQIAFLYCGNGTTDAALNIYNVNPQTFDVINTPTGIVLSGLNAVNTAFVATDLQGRSMILGDPTIIDLTNTDQPSVVLGAPPMHVDFVSPDPVDKVPPTVMNLSAIPDTYNNTYENDTSDAHPHTENQKTSWSWGAKETFSGQNTIGDLEGSGWQVGDKFTAAQQLKGSIDTITGSFSSQKFSLKTTSGLDDSVTHKDTSIRIWLYPVIGQTVCPTGKTCPPDQQVPLTIQFSAPTTNTSPEHSDGSTLSWFQPPWEPGNILSYPANLSQLQSIYPGSGTCPSETGPIQQTGGSLCLLASGDGFFTDGSTITQTTTWDVTSQTGTNTSFNQNYSFENDLSVTAAYGVKGVANFQLGFDFDVSGSVGFSHLTNDSTTLGTSTGLSVNKPGTFLSPETRYEYLAIPYIFGDVVTGGDVDNQSLNGVNTFGLVRAVFTADPLASGAGGWWQQAYTQAPDVALNHPARWTYTPLSLPTNLPPNGSLPSNCLATGDGKSMDCTGLSPRTPDNPWLSTYHQMRGFFISRAATPGQGPQVETANAGDVLTLQARVYNYSLKSMDPDTEVHVRFYFTPWNGTLAAGPSVLINEVVANPIPAFNDSQGAPPNWVLVPTTFDTSQFAETKDGNATIVFWVVVWMQDHNGNKLNEMPGHGLTGIPPAALGPNDSSLFSAVSNVEECQSDGNCYSNNVGFFPQVFYIASASLGVVPGPSNSTVNIGKIDVSADRVTRTDNVVLSTTLSSSGGAASGVNVKFYDGDPDQGGQSFAVVRIPHIAEDAPYPVQALFRSNSCGVHQLFAVVNRARSSEVVRRAHPVRVACNAAR